MVACPQEVGKSINFKQLKRAVENAPPQKSGLFLGKPDDLSGKTLGSLKIFPSTERLCHIHRLKASDYKHNLLKNVISGSPGQAQLRFETSVRKHEEFLQNFVQDKKMHRSRPCMHFIRSSTSEFE